MTRTTGLEDANHAITDPRPLFGVHVAHLADATRLNRSLAIACERVTDDPDTRRSHFFHGRFENLYPPREKLPELTPLLQAVERAARRVLDSDQGLRIGFWLNRMEPGHLTTLHTHDENDELLSAVYYVTVPARSGRLVFRDPSASLYIDPEPGMLVLFTPDLPHEVETHDGTHTRVSVAFNIGPANPAL